MGLGALRGGDGIGTVWLFDFLRFILKSLSLCVRIGFSDKDVF